MKADDAKKLSDEWRNRCNFDQEFFNRLKVRMYEFVETKAKQGEVELNFSFHNVIVNFENIPDLNLNECKNYQKRLEEDLINNGYRVKSGKSSYEGTHVMWGHSIFDARGTY